MTKLQSSRRVGHHSTGTRTAVRAGVGRTGHALRKSGSGGRRSDNSVGRLLKLAVGHARRHGRELVAIWPEGDPKKGTPRSDALAADLNLTWRNAKVGRLGFSANALRVSKMKSIGGRYSYTSI